jgi:MarR family transcriptional regulator for hemolysin
MLAPPFEDPLGRRFVFTAKALQARFEAALAEAGSSRTTWSVLLHVLHRSGLTQRELAERLGVEGPTLVRHLDRLCTEGLVRRDADPHDRRVTRIVATAAGRAHQRRIAGVAGRFDRELRAALTDRGCAALVELLDRLDAYLKETDHD